MAKYPDHNVDPLKKKEKEFILKDVQAFWNDNASRATGMFYAKGSDYDLWRAYGMGKQLSSTYHSYSNVDAEGNTFTQIPRDIIAFISSKRDRLIKKMMEQQYNIVATPIDMQGRDATKTYYADLKAKLMMRQAAIEQGRTDMLNHPMLALSRKDPQDLEELEMRFEAGEQFVRALDAEIAIALMFHLNNIDEIELECCEDLIDWGVTAMVDDLDANGLPVLRRADARHLLTNKFIHKDGSDMTRWGEIIIEDEADLINLWGFTKEELSKTTPTIYTPANTMYGTQLGDGKYKVLQYEFITYDTKVWQIAKDDYGNDLIAKADYKKRNSKNDKYEPRKIRNVYGCKWVIGTDLVYQFGLKQDIKRSVNARFMAETSLSLHIITYSFHDMVTQSFMERVKPLIDEYQLNHLKTLNLKARMIPNGPAIDIEALESVSLAGAGGDPMTPLQLLDMMISTGIVLYRGKDLAGATGNYKPIQMLQNSSIQELIGLWQDKQNIISQINDMWGLNAMTDGGTPNPKMLNGVANTLTQNSQDAIWSLMNAKKKLKEKKAGEMMKRLQQSILRNGSYEGWMPAINGNRPEFIKADEGLSLADYGIMLEERPTPEEKQLLVINMQQDKVNGLIDTSDEFAVMSTQNMKQAWIMYAWRVRKNKEKKHQEALQMQQMNGQVQIQSATAAEAEKRKTLQDEITLKGQLIILEKNLELRNMQEQWKANGLITDSSNKTKITNQLIGANTKKDLERMKQGGTPLELPVDTNTAAPPPPMQEAPVMNVGQDQPAVQDVGVQQ